MKLHWSVNMWALLCRNYVRGKRRSRDMKPSATWLSNGASADTSLSVVGRISVVEQSQ